MKPGMFIVVEGPDGVGKSTLIQRTLVALRDEGVEAYRVSELTGTLLGQAGRPCLVGTNGKHMDPMAEVLFLLACKRQLIEDSIKPLVAQGAIVLCDRFTRSLVAYQHGLHDVPLDKLKTLLDLTDTNLVPDLELFLNAPSSVLRERRDETQDAMEVEALDRHGFLMKGFAEGRSILPRYYIATFDASQTEDAVFEEAYAVITRYRKFHQVAGLSINDR